MRIITMMYVPYSVGVWVQFVALMVWCGLGCSHSFTSHLGMRFIIVIRWVLIYRRIKRSRSLKMTLISQILYLMKNRKTMLRNMVPKKRWTGITWGRKNSPNEKNWEENAKSRNT